MALVSAVTERAFIERRERDWNALDATIRLISVRGIRHATTDTLANLSPLYRDVCADLARAKAARYSAPLVEYLQGLVAHAHTVMYGATTSSGAGRETTKDGSAASLRFRDAFGAFPRAVRKRWRSMSLAAALFIIPFVFGAIATTMHPEFAFRVVPEAMLKPLTDAYQQGFNGRGTGEDALMAGFYVNNNIGIALRCFALGIFGGLGSAFYLVQNGLATGAMLGYVSSQGAGGNILTFVVGHSTFELGAIIIAGGAGMSMGWSVVAPGERTRLASLRSAAGELVVVVAGATVMLLFAAAIEGFWSASSVPSGVKRIVGVVNFVLVMSYILFAGRVKRTPDARPQGGTA
jgi:uncharacterized membrane protein SpoIIM required for sporulation